MILNSSFHRKGQARLRATRGQVFLLTILALGSSLLAATTIAGLLMFYQLRQAGDFANSAEAIFAADAGIEWGLYNFFCVPSATKTCPIPPVVFTNGARLEIDCVDGALNDVNCYNPGPGSLPVGVGYWALDDGIDTTAADSAGNNDGTLMGNTAWRFSPDCVSDGCVEFDGAGDYVRVDDDAALNMGISDWTVTGWLKTPPKAAVRGVVNKRDHGGLGRFPGYQIQLEADNKLHAYFSGGALRIPVGSADNFADNTWHHFAIVFDRSSRMTIYRDGVSNGSNVIAWQPGSASNNRPLYLGAADGGAALNSFYDGFIDDVRIYNTVLAPLVISDIFNAGNPGAAVRGIKSIGSSEKSSRALYLPL